MIGQRRQAEFFVCRPDDLDALKQALVRYRAGAPFEPTTWIRATVKDALLLKDLGVSETGMLASASDYHTFHKFMPGGRRQAKGLYLEAVHAVLDAGIRPRLHFEDATRASPDFMSETMGEALALAAPFGARQRPKFRVCDTMGLGLPFEDVPAPRGIPRLFRELRAYHQVTAEDFEFHPHNDLGLALANSLAALRAGCAVINGTCLGKGERTGNAPLEQVPALLGRPLEVTLTKESGVAGIIFVVRQKTGRDLPKSDEAIQSAHTYAQSQFASGRQTAIEWEEIARFFK